MNFKLHWLKLKQSRKTKFGPGNKLLKSSYWSLSGRKYQSQQKVEKISLLSQRSFA